jgi:riboflavin transporter FmnP
MSSTTGSTRTCTCTRVLGVLGVVFVQVQLPPVHRFYKYEYSTVQTCIKKYLFGHTKYLDIWCAFFGSVPELRQ